MLAKAPAKGEALPSDVFYHVIGTPAVHNPEGLQITEDAEGHRIVNLIMAEDWRAPITLYLQGHYHPTDRNEAKRLKHRSRDFAIVRGQLYKKAINQPMLKCITETEGLEILCDVHGGTDGSHRTPGPRSQGDSLGILLARNSLHGQPSHQVMRGMPKVFSSLRKPFAIH